MDEVHPCEGCIYSAKAHGLIMCNYIFIMDKRRPCPPGKACTVKTTGNELKKEMVRKARNRDAEYMEKRLEVRMRIATCPICGTVFKTDDSRKKFCSEKCYTIHRRRVWVEQARARREKKKQTPTGDANT